MALEFQYNKVALQSLQRQLGIRVSALPTLKSKEAHLRLTIRKEKENFEEIQASIVRLRERVKEFEFLFAEFPEDSLTVQSVNYERENIAGISIPALGKVRFNEKTSVPLLRPAWLPWGWNTLEEIFILEASLLVTRIRLGKLELARRKTTQKVNLYEKVQIPEFAQAILKIKRYMEDVENLAKAAQKITKSRQAVA